MAAGGLRLEGGKWAVFKPQGQKLLDPALLSSPAQKQRFTRIMNKLMSE